MSTSHSPLCTMYSTCPGAPFDTIRPPGAKVTSSVTSATLSSCAAGSAKREPVQP
jgi:hypothetical protein